MSQHGLYNIPSGSDSVRICIHEFRLPQQYSMLFSCSLLSKWTWITQNHSPSIPKLAAQAPNPTPWKCCRPCQRLRCQKLRTSPLSRSLDHGENCTAKKRFITVPLLPTVSASIHIYVYHDALYGMFIYIYIYTTRINDNIYYNMCLRVWVRM